MSTRRFRRVDRRTAEQQGLGGTPDRARDPLDKLLADVSAPAHASELAGEEAAVAAFRSARLAETTQPRRRSMHRLTKLVTVKVAAAAIGAMAVGGVAFAAATGNLPSQDSPAVPATSSGSSTVPGDNPGKGDPQNDKNTPNKPSDKPGNDNPGNENNANNPSPSPSMHGLCQAYKSGPASEHGKRLENPAFGALITAAGGTDKVPAYCDTVLSQRPNEQKPDEQKPGKPDEPGKPAQPGERGNNEQPGKPNGTPPSERPNN